MKRSDMEFMLTNMLNTGKYIVADELLQFIEKYMIPKPRNTDPEYHSNGKQLETKIVYEWKKEDGR